MKIIFVAVISGLAFWGYTRFLECHSIFYPTKEIVQTPADAGLPFRDVHFTSQSQVSLHGWIVPARESAASASWLLYLHGNGGNISGRVDKIAAFSRMGLNVFIIDYRGYGKSSGRPTENGLYDDGVAAFDYLVEQEAVAADRIVVYGVSLGGVVATVLASRRPVAALILDSTFTSAVDMAKVMYPFIPSFFVSVRFDAARAIAKISAPKLFFHSAEDEIVPYHLGRRLYEGAAPPKHFVALRGGHNDGYVLSAEEFLGSVKSFLRSNNLL